jgi:hypothetical protein
MWPGYVLSHFLFLELYRGFEAEEVDIGKKWGQGGVESKFRGDGRREKRSRRRWSPGNT